MTLSLMPDEQPLQSHINNFVRAIKKDPFDLSNALLCIDALAMAAEKSGIPLEDCRYSFWETDDPLPHGMLEHTLQVQKEMEFHNAQALNNSDPWRDVSGIKTSDLIPLMDRFLKWGYPANQTTPAEDQNLLHLAIPLLNLDLMATLLKHKVKPNYHNGYGHTVLYELVDHTYPDQHFSDFQKHTMELLIQHGANIKDAETSGWSLLHCASRNGYAGMTHFLLSQGAPLILNQDGDSPLHYASSYGHVPVMEALLQSQPFLDSLNNGNGRGTTPLHLSAAYHRLEVARCLLSHGANPNVQDQAGRTPISLAVAGHPENFSAEMMDLFIQSGADPVLPDHKGQTPLGYAHQYSSPKAITYLSFVEQALREKTELQASLSGTPVSNPVPGTGLTRPRSTSL